MKTTTNSRVDGLLDMYDGAVKASGSGAVVTDAPPRFYARASADYPYCFVAVGKGGVGHPLMIFSSEDGTIGTVISYGMGLGGDVSGFSVRDFGEGATLAFKPSVGGVATYVVSNNRDLQFMMNSTPYVKIKSSDGTVMIGTTLTDDGSGAKLQVESNVNLVAGSSYMVDGVPIGVYDSASNILANQVFE
jgi:hypothetical protein